ncbi:NAD+ synthase [Paracoccaceae bacterium]|nr:NAD+ synthase [Paracoccaceae bacterium]
MGANQLKISLVQSNSIVGGIRNNAESILAKAIEAEKKGSDLIVFPEMFLSGYQPLDLVNKRSFLEDIFFQVQNIAQQANSLNIRILIGAPWRLDSKIYNALISIFKGSIKVVSKKFHLPNYDVFDEKRFFVSGNGLDLLELGNIKIGFPICEDAWHSDIIEQLKNLGADIIIIPNGSPYETNKLVDRQKIIKNRCKESNLPIIYLNLVGGQDDIVFDGGSFVLDNEGATVCQFPQFAEKTEQVIFEERESVWRPLSSSITKIGSDASQDYSAIVLGLRDYVLKSNFQKVVIGLSGGIDSALVAVMAVDALGSDNVACLALPSKFNSMASIDDARRLSENLGITFETIGIQEIMDKTDQILSPLFFGKKRDVTEENIQSRLRAVLLMAFSNKQSHLLLSTGNKSEIAVGYSTIYGDMAGAYNPLKDVYKTKVYKLSKWRNSSSETSNFSVKKPIPDNILFKEPSAELAFDQKDTDSLPSYDELDMILEHLIEDDLGVNEVIKKGHLEKTVVKVKDLLNLSEYKRYQACLGPKISRRPFSLGRRMPVVNHWRG